MMVIGGFGWVVVGVPVAILISGGWLGNQLEMTDQGRKAARIQLELARASLPGTELAAGAATKQLAQGVRDASTLPGTGVTAAPPAGRRRLVEDGDPRTRPEVVARLDRLVANVRGLVDETDVATLQRIRDSAALALAPTDAPLDLADHETWLLRQICIDYLPSALEHYIALPPDRASEPVLDGRSARQVLDEQLALIESRLDQMATRTYQREAGGLLTHARFLGDVLRPDPFQARLAKLAGDGPDPGLVAAAGAGSHPRNVGDNGRGGRPDARARLIRAHNRSQSCPTSHSNCRRPRRGRVQRPIRRTPRQRPRRSSWRRLRP